MERTQAQAGNARLQRPRRPEHKIVGNFAGRWRARPGKRQRKFAARGQAQPVAAIGKHDQA
jgi:hypothetical protein